MATRQRQQHRHTVIVIRSTQVDGGTSNGVGDGVVSVHFDGTADEEKQGQDVEVRQKIETFSW